MGVYIPNIDMPTNCHECDALGISDIVGLPCDCEYDFNHVPKDCPLIEIDLVKCGECKHGQKHMRREVYDCYKSDITTFYEADHFCSYGEKKNR